MQDERDKHDKHNRWHESSHLPAFKRYKTLPEQGKLACLITEEDMQIMRQRLEQMQ